MESQTLAIIPVIMCGGAGSRLWPASTRQRPKPFLDLIGDTDLFSATVERLVPLLEPGSDLIIVAGETHQAVISQALAGLGRTARLILEPEGRDSGPAMAAAAVEARRLDPEAVIAVVASDHHVPDAEDFRRAVRIAAGAAQSGRIVTLGVTPAWPSSAFGYIAPGPGDADGVRPIEAFVEKPAPDLAADYIARGYLWNSGNFIVRADVLAAEIGRFEPAMLVAAEAAVHGGRDVGGAWRLSDAFRAAPKISIDYAVMEKTDRTSVLAVDFDWSDIGGWDAVIAAGGTDRGEALRLDAGGGLIRAGDGMSVAVIGVSDLIVVAEGGQVLVTRPGGDGRIREAAARFSRPATGTPDLAGLATAFADWLRLRALPLWTTLGRTEDGRAYAALTSDGRPTGPLAEPAVQARLQQALSGAAARGWRGPWPGSGQPLVDDPTATATGAGLLEVRQLNQALAAAVTDRSAERLQGVAEALAALLAGLTPDGLWSESPDGADPARAETLCELLAAFEVLAAVSAGTPGFPRPLDLS